MSVRKRTWINGKGEEKTAWVVDYTDARGKRRLKTFAKKKEADQFAATAAVEIREGVHVAERDTVTVQRAGELWIESSEAAGLERSTIEAYRQRLNLHIVPFIGDEKLTKITVPAARAFADKLRSEGRSPAMVGKAMTALGALLSDAQERGLVTRNAVKEMSRRRNGAEKRKRKLLEVGVDIPAPDEIRAFLSALEGRWRPILLTAVFSGLRSSELRGLRWQDVELEKATITVRQRADKWGEIGSTKSHAGQRTVPVPPVVVNTLKEWKVACPPGDLVFPNGKGNPESHSNVVNRGLKPAMKKAGLPYTGLHALRHFYASWLINPKEAGGLSLDMKTVQARMGHSSIAVTADVYSHLFPRKDDGKEMADAASALLG
ncbi:tyrosine-type recombinase/integrase [Nitratireductor basaltis]|uniref:Phage integrase family protein n=1 Tax=Nitratireductor basaltis TaxID=472175 RepID=A0A084UBZ9_9HYPH|nr:site-specific integrase [Nitratireductor basaltis]KFB10485.1 Phage integrase family protein [Nitratireductor basaltis]